MDHRTKQKVFHAIRQSFKESDRYSSELQKALSITTGPRGGKRYTCSHCKAVFEAKQIELNHAPPVCEIGKVWHSYSVEEYYERVFSLPVEALCKSCHSTLTKAQNKLRRQKKSSSKSK